MGQSVNQVLYHSVCPAGLVIQASGSCLYFEVDIPELSASLWPGIDSCCTSMGLGLGRRIVKELDLKLTLRMAER